jgi:transcriptional regulator NrdR family protein
VEPIACQSCGGIRFQVIDTRPVRHGIRRRKVCLSCKHRITTYERMRDDAAYIDEEDMSAVEKEAAQAIIKLLRLQRPA